MEDIAELWALAPESVHGAAAAAHGCVACAELVHLLAYVGEGWDSKWLGTTDVSAFNTAVIEVESVIGHGKINFEAFEIDLPASETAYSVTADISSVASIEQYAYQNVYKSNPEDPSISVPDGETVIKVKKVYLTSKTKQEVDDERIATGIEYSRFFAAFERYLKKPELLESRLDGKAVPVPAQEKAHKVTSSSKNTDSNTSLQETCCAAKSRTEPSLARPPRPTSTRDSSSPTS